MAVTLTATTLTAAEQTAQARLGTLYATLALRLWLAKADPSSIDESARKLFELLIPQILKGRLASATSARRYYQTFRVLETPDKTIWRPPAPITGLDKAVLETSLRVTGPVKFKQGLAKISGADLTPEAERVLTQALLKEAGKSIAAAVTRHVIDGGRDEVMTDTKADPVALGFMRVTKSTNPCFFCAMLASRGPVYGAESFDASDPRFIGDGVAKAHDNCSCILEPVFSRATNLPDLSKKANEIWGLAKKNPVKGQTTTNTFRTLWNQR